MMVHNQSHYHIRATRVTQMADLLDRILDKGIVIDAWGPVFLTGVDFGIRWEARMVVASIDTYLKHAGPIGLLDSVAWRFARRHIALNPG
jgi:Gas vesicle protein